MLKGTILMNPGRGVQRNKTTKSSAITYIYSFGLHRFTRKIEAIENK